MPAIEKQYSRSVVAVPQPNGDIHVQERRRTRKELAIYNLHRMHGFAVQNDVPLRGLDPTDPGHALPASLQSAIESWQSSGGSLDTARKYLDGFIHTSHSIYKLDLGPESSGKRTVFYNKPAQAVAPSRTGVARAQ